MNPADVFSENYEQAKARFRDAAARRGAWLQSTRNPARSPSGVALTTDVAWLGRSTASRVLVIISGTHGVEGFAGSAIQTAWLHKADPSTLPDDLAVMLVHALNPFGFAWQRRVNEDNVDLNRNFVNWDLPRVENDGYHTLHEALMTDEADTASRAWADAVLQEFIGRYGASAFQEALARGQYQYSEGLFYGGSGPTWSARVIESLAMLNLGGASEVALVDLHTGLGAYGEAQIVAFDAPGSKELRRAQAWFGKSVGTPGARSSISSNLDGTLYEAWKRWLGNRVLTSVAVEFGTHSVPVALAALRAEAIAWRDEPYGGSQKMLRARAALRAFFDVPSEEWRVRVLSGGLDVLHAALEGLAGGRVTV
ncbi:DUF2817 domain-containing protein [Burkholderia multivorans]|jgi:hypothetical protein|uniref:DUF2817 domain-containing protein n=1 Tax=Burkholderia multivorans TaxID=87883 RepID=UPI000AFA7AD3|nr:DUF2817 domain-containing protein [Burkholderia multivorans]MDR9229093.1 hypothetical protein [Burkholderia multivorans]